MIVSVGDLLQRKICGMQQHMTSDIKSLSSGVGIYTVLVNSWHTPIMQFSLTRKIAVGNSILTVCIPSSNIVHCTIFIVYSIFIVHTIFIVPAHVSCGEAMKLAFCIYAN